MNALYYIGTMLASKHTSSSMLKLFAFFREDCLQMTTLSVKLATGLACLFVLFSMIQMSYKMMSDDDRAGFGGITLKEILRPVVILILIQTCPTWIGLMDNVLGGVTNAVTKTVEDRLDNGFAIQLIIDSDKALTEDEEEMYQSMNQTITAQITDDMTRRQRKKAVKEGLEEWEKQNGVSFTQAIEDAIIDSYKLPKGLKKQAPSEEGELEWNIHSKNFIPSICNWLYDKFFVVIMIMAEVILMILAMLAPWTLAFSLLPPWRSAINQFFGSYVQVSFWQVIASMINLVACMMRRAVVQMSQMAYTTNGALALQAGLNGQAYSESVDYAGTGNWLSAIVSIACLLLIFKVPKIANALLPGGSDFGDMGTAGFGLAAGAAKKVGEKATKAGGAIVKTAIGKVVSARRAKKQ